MRVVSVSDVPALEQDVIHYFQDKWGNEKTNPVYEDAIHHSINKQDALPEWYVLIERETIIGGVALITNDFISRMDLYPWLAALVVNEDRRGENLSRLLIEHVIAQAKEKGFKHLYLATDHQGFYEKHGFYAMGEGYHPWGEMSQIYLN